MSDILLRKLLLAAIYISLFQFSIFNFLACENINCPLNNTVESIYGFYASARSTGSPFQPGGAIKISDTLTITALGADTIIANRLVNRSRVALPVSYYGEIDSLRFAFTSADGSKAADTIWMTKENFGHIDDPSCPLHMWHNVLYVRSTHHLIDTVLINHTEINYDANENLQIYFRTQD